MSSCLKELEKSLLARSNEPGEVSYPPELRDEARETYILTNGRNPTERELDNYISSGQEVKDFYRLRNDCLV